MKLCCLGCKCVILLQLLTCFASLDQVMVLVKESLLKEIKFYVLDYLWSCNSESAEGLVSVLIMSFAVVSLQFVICVSTSSPAKSFCLLNTNHPLPFLFHSHTRKSFFV